MLNGFLSSLILVWSGGCALNEVPATTEKAGPALVTNSALTALRLAVWTNFIAHTNGKSMDEYEYNPPQGRYTPPVRSRRNTNCLTFNSEGFTGVTLENEYSGQGASGGQGQVQGTLITRRHCVFRGHGFSDRAWALGIRSNPPVGNQRVWFMTASNTLVEMVTAGIIGTAGEGKGDWTLAIFTKDVPDSIEVLPLVRTSDYKQYLRASNSYPAITVYECQHKKTAIEVNPFFQMPFSHDHYIGGDSGSADCMLLPSATGRRFKLALIGGRGCLFQTNYFFQALDALTVWRGLNTNRYQPTFVDLSRYR